VPLVERELISRIRRLAGRSTRNKAAAVTAGIGDDCAVLRIPAGHEALITTDFSLEDVHFRRDWHSPQFIGHRCLTRGLSDIAAMGGEPIAVFLSLALPARIPQKWVNGFFEGLLKLANKFHVPLAGGDTTQSPDRILADIVVLGSAPQGQAILRSGARPGDRIYVTGALGAAAAETDFLYSHAHEKASNRIRGTLPQPRLTVGRILRERKIATSMIDISDGLSTDLSHICEESEVGAELWQQATPRGKLRGREVDLRFALHGGDAYELLFTAKRTVRVPTSIDGVPVTAIGEVTRTKNMIIIDPAHARRVLRPQGWEHFRQRSSSKQIPDEHGMKYLNSRFRRGVWAN
jgi:thiamine-monophosphate kinase